MLPYPFVENIQSQHEKIMKQGDNFPGKINRHLIQKDGFTEEITKGNMIQGTVPYVATHITTCCIVIKIQQSAEPYTKKRLKQKRSKDHSIYI